MILVIGASGRVGGELLGQYGGEEVMARLLERQMRLRVLTPSAHLTKAFEARGMDAVCWDTLDDELLERACRDVSRLFLVTPGSAEQVTLQCRAIAAAARAGVRQIVKISDLGAEPGSDLVHAQWNWTIEAAIRESGVPYTFIRPRFFMQTLLLVVAPSVMAEDVFFAPPGNGRVALVDVRDIADVAVAALVEPGHAHRVYELTGPEELSFTDVARILSEGLQRDIRCVETPPEEVRSSLVQSGLPGWFADDLVEAFSRVRDGRSAGLTGTVSDVAGHPARALAEFVQANRDAFQTAYV